VLLELLDGIFTERFLKNKKNVVKNKKNVKFFFTSVVYTIHTADWPI